MPALQDITGMKFGRLTVLGLSHRQKEKRVYLCECECGNKASVHGSALRTGHTKSCGCQRHDSNLKKLKDLTGRRFGRLVVLGVSHRDKHGDICWKCICDCGNTSTPLTGNITSGVAKSCGCIREEKATARFREMSGEKHPCWRGGNKGYLYPREVWTEELRESIRNRDDRRCQYPDCHFTDAGANRKLHVHHIDRDKKNCKPYNLVSLCISHHKVVEFNPEYWMGYFYSITRDYEYA